MEIKLKKLFFNKNFIKNLTVIVHKPSTALKNADWVFNSKSIPYKTEAYILSSNKQPNW
jgi:hypothetical protein